MAINECHNCKHANEYLCWWWHPHYDPTCKLGLPMNTHEHCLNYKQIGRGSR